MTRTEFIDLLDAYWNAAYHEGEAAATTDTPDGRAGKINSALMREYDALAARLAEAERNEETLLGMIRHQRDVLRECLPYINESMAGRRPGRSADDIRAAVKALTTDSASVQENCRVIGDGYCTTHKQDAFMCGPGKMFKWTEVAPNDDAADQPDDVAKT